MIHNDDGDENLQRNLAFLIGLIIRYGVNREIMTD